MLLVFYLYGLYALNSSETAIEFSSHNPERRRTSALGYGFHWLLLACKLTIYGHGYKQYKYNFLVVSFQLTNILSAPSAVCASVLWFPSVWYCCFVNVVLKAQVELVLLLCLAMSRARILQLLREQQKCTYLICWGIFLLWLPIRRLCGLSSSSLPLLQIQ